MPAMPQNLQDKVRRLEDRYQLIADQLVDAIWVVDAQTLSYDFITDSVQKLSGYSPEEYQGLTLRDRLPAAALARLEEALGERMAAFERGDAGKRSLEVELVRKDGEPYWLELTARLFRDREGRLKVAGVSKDITRRKRAERERERLVAELEEAVAQRDRALRENRLLRELLPVCAACRRIRDEKDRWWPLEAYVAEQTGARLTHTICPDCQQVMYAADLEPRAGG
jgi:PAS domain S-box-containing protein